MQTEKEDLVLDEGNVANMFPTGVDSDWDMVVVQKRDWGSSEAYLHGRKTTVLTSSTCVGGPARTPQRTPRAQGASLWRSGKGEDPPGTPPVPTPHKGPKDAPQSN